MSKFITHEYKGKTHSVNLEYVGEINQITWKEPDGFIIEFVFYGLCATRVFFRFPTEESRDAALKEVLAVSAGTAV